VIDDNEPQVGKQKPEAATWSANTQKQRRGHFLIWLAVIALLLGGGFGVWNMHENLKTTVRNLEHKVQTITNQIVKITEKAIPGPKGDTGPAGASIVGDISSSGPSTSCDKATCVILQGNTPGTSQTGNLNISGGVAAGHLSGSGTNLTELNASNISSGTLADSRLPSNIARLDGTGPQTFTGHNLFRPSTNSDTAFQVQDSTGTPLLIADTANTELKTGNLRPTVAGGLSIGLASSGLVSVQTPSYNNYSDHWIAVNPVTDHTAFVYERSSGNDSSTLNFGQCSDSSCTEAAETTVIDASVGSLTNPSLRFTAGGVPVIAYQGYDTEGFLKIATYVGNGSGTGCSETSDWSCVQVGASTGDTSGPSSLAIDRSGNAVLSYVEYDGDLDTYSLKLVTCNNSACSAPVVSTLDTISYADGQMYGSLLGLDANDAPQVVYEEYNSSTNFDGIRLLICNNASCDNPTIQTIDGATDGGYAWPLASPTVDPNGHVSLLYESQDASANSYLQLAICNNASCSNPTTRALDSLVSNGNGYFTSGSASFDVNGLLKIAYSASNSLDSNTLSNKYVLCNNPLCTIPRTTVLTNDNLWASSASLALGSNGFGRVGVWDSNMQNAEIINLLNSTGTDTLVGSTIGSSDSRYVSISSMTLNLRADDPNALLVQDASGLNVMNVDTVNKALQLGIGSVNGVNGTLVFNSATANNYAVTLIASSNLSTSYILKLPTSSPVTSMCLKTDSSDSSQLVFAECGGSSASGVTAVGALDSQGKDPNGAVISGSNIYMQTADSSHPGIVSTGTQTIAGNKTFTGSTTIKTDSADALRVQNATGTNLFQVDTADSQIKLGNVNDSAVLSIDSNNNYVSVGGQLDVSNIPTSPKDITDGGIVAAAAGIDSFSIVGSYAYLAEQAPNKLQIFDISNPKHPVDITNGGVSTAGEPKSIYVSGHYAYIANQSYDPTSKLQVFDITNPANPADVTNGGIVMCIPTGARSIYVANNYAYIACAFGQLQIFDVSNPANPVSIASVSDVYGWNPAIYLSGNYAYVVGDQVSKLQVFDITNPANPVDVTNGGVNTANGPQSVYVADGYAYVADTSANKLQIFNVTDPTNPVDITNGGVDTANSPQSVYVSEGYAYVGSGTAVGKLQIFDITNPANPVDVTNGGVNTGNYPIAVQTLGRYIYVGGWSGLMQIFDRDPVSAEVGSLRVDTNAWIDGDTSIQGNLSVGQSLQVTGNVDMSGQVLMKNSSDSATAFQVQNASGTTLLGVDTASGQIFSGIADSGAAIGFSFDTPAYTTAGAKLISVQNDGSEKFAIDKDGNIFIASGAAIAFQGTGRTKNVITKKFICTATTSPGDVVVIDAANPGQVTTATTANSTLVAGVVSSGASAGQTCEVATHGVIQANVDTGEVLVGDLLTTSTSTGLGTKGIAAVGDVFGKALEAKAAGSGGSIWVLLNLQ
jgi:hypothetical protein